MKEAKSLIELRIDNLRIRTDIEQMYIDAISWNQNVRKKGEPVIDPDPDGVAAANWMNFYEKQRFEEDKIYRQFEQQFQRKRERFEKWKGENPNEFHAMIKGLDSNERNG